MKILVIGGGGHEPVDMENLRAHVHPRRTLMTLAQLPRVVPTFNRLNIIRVWSGIEGYLPDMLPIISRSVASSLNSSPFSNAVQLFSGLRG